MKSKYELNKPTDGPWTFSGIAGDNYVMASKGGRQKVIIAQVFGHPSLSDTEFDANKQLIASAPDLLTACQAARNWLLPYPESPQNPHANSLRALMDQIQDAISKSTSTKKEQNDNRQEQSA